MKVETQEETIKALIAYITYCKLARTVDRDLLMARTLIEKIERKAALKGRPPNARSVVPLYDAIISNTTEIAGLRSEDDIFAKQCAANLLSYSSQRCYYLALSYLQTSKWAEALALFKRAQQHVAAAVDHQKHLKTPDTAVLEELGELDMKIRGKLCAVRAQSFLEENKPAPKTEPASPREPYNILKNLDEYDTEGRALKEERLVDFPPDFEPVPCKPILFDLAMTTLEFPDLSKRKKAKGFFSFWK